MSRRDFDYDRMMDEPSTLQILLAYSKSPIVTFIMALSAIVIITADSSVFTVSSKKNDGKYKGDLPNSLLTLDYPFTLMRDVVLSQPIVESDVPFIWHPHKSDKKLVHHALHECYGINVRDLDSLEDIRKAKDLGLASRGHKNVVFTSPFLREALEIFTPEHMGRGACLFRHPLDYDLHEELPKFEESSNWMLRYIANQPSGNLGYKQLGSAKLVLRKICVIATIDKMEESIKRMADYFGWKRKDGADEDCVEGIVEEENAEEHFLDHETQEWEDFYSDNSYDCQLYELAQSTWRGQIQTIIPHRLQIARERGVRNLIDEESEDKDEVSK